MPQHLYGEFLLYKNYHENIEKIRKSQAKFRNSYLYCDKEIPVHLKR